MPRSARSHFRPRRLWSRLFLAAAVVGTAFAGACISEEDALLAALGQGCLLDSDCDGDLICAFRRCHTQCESSADCPPESRCTLGEPPRNVCLLDVQCTLHSDCMAGQVCGPDLECRDACLNDRDCPAEQVCTERLCADPDELVNGLLQHQDGQNGEGRPCAVNSECVAPLMCLGGRCLLECTTDADCPGAECVDMACTVPAPPPPECVPNAQGACMCQGSSGVRVCGPSGLWGACDCTSMGVGGAGGAGGAGGVGGAGGSGGGTVVLGSFSPMDGAVDQEPDATITVTAPNGGLFDVASVTPSSFFVAFDGVVAPLQSTNVVTDTITVAQPARLPLATTIDVAFTAAVTVEGTPVEAGGFSFGVRQGAWGSDVLTNAMMAGIPSVSLAKSGNGFVAFTDGAGVVVLPVDADSGVTMGTSSPVYTGTPVFAQVGVESGGTAQLLVMAGDMFAVRFDGTAWDLVPTTLDGEPGTPAFPGLVMDDVGNALAVWTQLEAASSRERVFAAQFPIANLWSPATPVDDLAAGDVDMLSVAVDGVNSFTIAYKEQGTDAIYVRTSSSGVWGAKQQIFVGAAFLTERLKVVANSDTAEAAVMWSVASNDPIPLMVARRTAGVWAPAETITPPSGVTLGTADLAIDPGGNVALVFEDLSAAAAVWGSTYRVAVGSWSSPVALHTQAAAPAVGYQPSGDLILAYTTFVVDRANATIYADGDFAAPTNHVFDSASATVALSPRISIDQLGRALVAWRDINMSFTNILTSRLE